MARQTRRLALASAGLFLVVPLAGRPLPGVAASTISVPGNQPTIQAAINAAQNGDTVVVAPGTYYENLNFGAKAITVESSNGPASTIIDGRSLGPVVSFTSGETTASVLQGFTLQHGQTSFEGGGIYISSASPTIVGNVITNNQGCNGGGGITAAVGSPVIQGNTITGNGPAGCSGGVGGGGIEVRGAGSAQIIGNTISNNSWRGGDGGGISLFAAGTPTIEDNVISGNTAGDAGGGIYAVNQSDATIVQNLIIGNSAPGGAALYSSPPSGTRGPWLVNNTVAGNTGLNGVTLLDGFDEQIQLWNNAIVGTVVCQTTYQSTPPSLVANDVYNSGGAAYLGACSGEGGTSGNISADPVFVSPSTGDYHLQAGSPAIDAGNRTAPALPATDLDGTVRVQGISVDQGVYEYPGPVLTVPGPVTHLTVTTGPKQTATVTWSAPLSNGGSPVTGYYGSAVSSIATHTFSQPPSQTSVTFSNISPKVKWTFTVSAQNALGAGPSVSVVVSPH